MTPRPIMAILNKYNGRADKTMSLGFETNELTPDEVLYIAKLHTKQGYLFFAEAPFTEVIIPEVKLGEFETKTPSQRMHNVIYRLWEKSDKSKDSEAYYKYTMEKIIDQLKEKLN